MTVPASIDERLQRIRGLMREEGVSALIAFAPADCRYLTGFTGEAASAVVTMDDLALVTDSRFTVQAEEEISGTRVLLADDGRDEPASRFLTGTLGLPSAGAGGEGSGDASPARLPVAVDAGRLTVKRWERLQVLLEESGLTWRLVEGLVEKARLTKFPDELAAMRAAGALAASAFAYLETLSVVGRSESDVALDLELFLRRHGSEGVAFPFIVAAGPRGAMPHAEASDAVIETGQLVVFDLGAVIDGYASDITRTYATGRLDMELKEAYEQVRAAQAAALAAARSGIPCKALDKVARDHLAEAGMADRFVHSLGHGVGLEIHEGPGVGPRSTDVLEEDMVITIEPGVYLPGRGGVRIEDSVVITASGAEILTEYPRELRILV